MMILARDDLYSFFRLPKAKTVAYSLLKYYELFTHRILLDISRCSFVEPSSRLGIPPTKVNVGTSATHE